ncbi:stage II sporulation protein P [Oscillospiraceae bacterium LTW-04]|nr:stage II sporulation protein P [Oscillospiraceae bacterium MB24-C1]
MKKTEYKMLRRLKVAIAAAITLIALWSVLAIILPALSPLLVRTALFSAALTMPEGTVNQLKERFGTASAPASVSEAPASESTSVPTSSAEVVSQPLSDESASESEPPVIDSFSSAQPEIPKKYQGEVLAENMSGKKGGLAFPISHFWLRNYTSFSEQDIKNVLKQPMNIALENTKEPQVLIYHTHATESFCPYDSEIYDTRYNWRSTDNNNNMVAVGAVMAQTLREHGIVVLQDTSQHDYPSYDGSYANSYRAIKDYLVRYPTIKVVLDLHRDAIERDGKVIVKPTLEVNGKKYAQLMVIANCDDGSGLIPNWHENFRFAAAFSDRLELNTPGITRPLMFSYRKYNQQLSTGALLIEFGSHANTLDEAKNTAVLAGEALAQVLLETQKKGS